MPYATNNGVRIRYAVEGSGPSLLLHIGFIGGLEDWDDAGYVRPLARRFRVLRLDPRGQGQSDKPHDPAAYADLTTRIVEALPDGPVDIVGFSLGAMTTLRLAMRQPDRFNRIVVAGVGRNLFERDLERGARILAGVEGKADPDDPEARLFGQYAAMPGNDREALAALMRRPDEGVLDPADLKVIECPVLVVIGDRDFAGPGDPLAAALPNARLVVLRNTDHFATPESFGFIDAALEFLEAVPA